MGYQKPLVKVFQEYADLGVSPAQADLIPCIVGPAYHIIDLDDSDDKELSHVGRWNDINVSEIEPPENKPGAEVKEDSIKVLLEDLKLDISDGEVEFTGLEEDVITFESSDFVSDAKEGDLVKVIDGSDETVFEEAKITEVNSEEYKLTLDRSVEETIANGKVEIFREVDDKELTDVSFDGSYIDISSEKVDGKPIKDANIFVGYKSFRKDLARINTVYPDDNLEAVVGKTNYKENPLGMGVSIALTNTTTEVKFIGIDEDSDQGYFDAQSRLEGYDNVYAIVPLTTSVAVTSAYVGHCEQMSLPEVGQWRVTLFGSDFPEEKVLSEGEEGKPKEDSNEVPKEFKDSDASFMSDDVMAGDILRITDSNGEDHEYVVAGAISEDRLLLDDEIDTDKFTLGDPYPYEVIKELDRTGQANYIREISEGYGSSRAVHVWPSTCYVADQEVPGYFLACAVAGATGGLPSHRGFTRLSIGGIQEIENSNDYFNGSQLNTIAGGGTFIFTQENPDAPIVIRHQLTTDMSAIEFREFSFVKNFDYVSIRAKKTLDRYLGEYNITKATMGLLRNAMNALLESLRLYKLPKIGSPVLNYEVKNIYQHDAERDRIEMYVNVWFPYALNTIGLHIVSQGTKN